jgi:hypothetical protein
MNATEQTANLSFITARVRLGAESSHTQCLLSNLSVKYFVLKVILYSSSTLQFSNSLLIMLYETSEPKAWPAFLLIYMYIMEDVYFIFRARNKYDVLVAVFSL